MFAIIFILFLIIIFHFVIVMKKLYIEFRTINIRNWFNNLLILILKY